MIDEIKTLDEQISLNSLLNQNMLLLFNDENAYHIIIKIILEKPENQRTNINLFLIYNIKKIAINPYGSYCVNKFIVNNSDLKLRALFLNNIQKNIQFLFYHKCTHGWNSCSILFLLLKYYGICSCNFIFSEIQNQILYLVKNPISYSFVNKILLFLKKSGNAVILNEIINNICKDDNLLKSIHSLNNGAQFLQKLFDFINKNGILKLFVKEKLNVKEI